MLGRRHVFGFAHHWWQTWLVPLLEARNGCDHRNALVILLAAISWSELQML